MTSQRGSALTCGHTEIVPHSTAGEPAVERSSPCCGYEGLKQKEVMIGLFGTVGLAAAKTVVLSMLTEKMILKLTLMLLEWAAEKTSNEVDNKVVEMMKEQLKKTSVI